MKVIELITKRANGEKVPKQIRIQHWSYVFEWVEYLDNYYDENANVDFMSVLALDKEELNYEIEIIEEDKPIEKINGLNHSLTERLSLIREDIGLAFETIDLLIDKVNELEREMKE